MRLVTAEAQRTERRLRLLAILRSGHAAGIKPMNTSAIHSIAYLTDALSPVWHLPILDAQTIKQARRPFFPALQRDLDDLVGSGLVEVSRFEYVQVNGPRSDWALDGDYVLVQHRADHIFEVANAFPLQQRKLDFIREVAYAASGLGVGGLSSIGLLDAAYSDPLVDIGGLLDMATSDGKVNLTANVAERFSSLTVDTSRLSEAELVHLYIRHLYSRMSVA